jgi:hypothetical protein
MGAISIEMTPAAMIAPKIARAVWPSICIGHGHHRTDGSKSNAHHHGQADAKPLGSTHGLDQRDQTTDKKVGRDQEGHVGRFKFQCAPDDQGHGHGTSIHDKNMLQAKGE